VNDRVDVAIAAEADGVHLGGGSMPAAVARRLLPAGTLVGISTHAPGEAVGADFAFFGPVFATPSKDRPQGEARLREAVDAAQIPVLAIGGVTAEKVPALCTAGAHGVAVIRAILAAADPAAATRALVRALG
jgi:thiamine-phosphate pyrophosphorylase